MVHERNRGTVRIDRALGKPFIGRQGSDDPPGLVHAIGSGTEAHRRLQYLTGVARIRVGPAPRIRFGLKLLAHLAAVGKSTGVDEDAVAGLDVDFAPAP